jgi:hypothetical protein
VRWLLFKTGELLLGKAELLKMGELPGASDVGGVGVVGDLDA